MGRELSARWAAAGFGNQLDVSGQCASLWPMGDDAAAEALTEAEVDRAAAIARAYGLELRDRVGGTFRADNSLCELRGRMVYEYKSRLATAVVFVLPALGLHYFGGRLAGGTADAAAMILPWLFEALLIGWACMAAAWPILWQGGLAVVHLRVTGDVLTAAVIVGAFVPSLVMIVGAILGHSFDATPCFHAAGYATLIAVTGRWLLHRAAGNIAGRADLLMPRFSRLAGPWLLIAAAMAVMVELEAALALAILMPPLIGFAGINRSAPAMSYPISVVSFALLIFIGAPALNLNIDGWRIEIAAWFSMLFGLAMAWGWRGRDSGQVTE